MGLISRVSSRTYRTNASDNLVPSNLLPSTMPEIQTTFSLNLGRLSTVAVLFPLTALIFSVVYSIVYDFDRVISSPESPCKGQTVVDYLPSVTACFSKFYPQTWVWWIAVSAYTTASDTGGSVWRFRCGRGWSFRGCSIIFTAV